MTPMFDNGVARLYEGDCRDVLRELPAESVQTCVTSPPYWSLRDYGLGDGQLGLEPTIDLYVAHMVEVFREVRRVLRDDGTVWINMGDSYAGGGNGARDAERWPKQSRNNNGDRITHPTRQGAGLKPKDLCGIPWRVAFALQANGWWLRSDIVWSKPNPMPESVTDRPTRAHEYVFLLSKSARYHYDADAIREPVDTAELRARGGGSLNRTEGNGLDTMQRSVGTGRARTLGVNSEGRNKRSVWEVSTGVSPDAHFATFPQKLVEPCILAGCSADGTVLDPFVGSGTTAFVAQKLGRRAIGIDLSYEYLKLAEKRLRGLTLPMGLTQ